jgi:hypothetical protein
VSVAKAVKPLIEGKGSVQLLYPPNPLQLVAEEKKVSVLVSSFFVRSNRILIQRSERLSLKV